MSDSGETEKNGAFFLWKIENYSFGWNTENKIRSPTFSIRPFTNFNFCMFLYNKENYNEKKAMCCSLIFSSGNESSKKLEYSLSFLNANGFPEESLDTSSDFSENRCGNRLYVSLDELFIRRRKAFLPRDTLTLRCHVKRINSEVPAFIRSTALTRIGVERNLFTWNLSDFSSLRKGQKREIAVKSLGGKFSPLTLKLSIVGGPISEERIQIAVHRAASSAVNFYKLKISLLNNEKKSIVTIEDEFLFEYDNSKIWFLTPLIKISKLYAVKDQLLRNDVLSLKCESSNSFGVVSNLIEVVERGSDFLQDFGICNGTQYSCESLKDVMEQLLNEKTSCDVILRVGSAEFPAHKAILATRSPVFKAMFTCDMQETARNAVDISDLDADTVKRMLLYVYTDTLDHPEGDSVEKLYFAADKYEILCLKKKCALLLESDLRESNACRILLLADRHQDEYLKEAVCSFISKFRSCILLSEEWKSFNEGHSQLAIQVLHYIHLQRLQLILDGEKINNSTAKCLQTIKTKVGCPGTGVLTTVENEEIGAQK
ncbi:speckle-type POZ protein-like B [Caerostris extrusa]|uniref:Speckle-type POZ protein-like B n=1 Tax=Caerostris extrusa TaxID=172846 RepID=A0AAV4MKE5_CAEEX|nr:speckle-type POZ protein-like B [Caerostris extrusa]